MANRVHAAMQRVQASAPHSVIHGTFAQAKRQQLTSSHDPVLTLRQRRDSPVHLAPLRFPPYMSVNCSRTRHPADVAPETAPGKDESATTVSPERDLLPFLDACQSNPNANA